MERSFSNKNTTFALEKDKTSFYFICSEDLRTILNIAKTSKTLLENFAKLSHGG
jgi:hypothetical protein